ncbi:MAG: methyltransferase domain-containing protein [Nitrospirota bacterium]
MEMAKRDPYGRHGLTWVDRVGVFLSRRAILKHMPRAHELDILDLGCGYRASHLTSLRDIRGRLVGIDFQICPELKGDSRFSFLEGSVEQGIVKLEAESFDLVLFISALEHVWEPVQVLGECQRVMRPGGVLLVNVPTWRGKVFLEVSAFKLGTSPKAEMDDHKMYYDKRDLWPLLVRAGFRPSDIVLRYHKFGLNLFAVVRKPPRNLQGDEIVAESR